MEMNVIQMAAMPGPSPFTDEPNVSANSLGESAKWACMQTKVKIAKDSFSGSRSTA